MSKSLTLLRPLVLAAVIAAGITATGFLSPSVSLAQGEDIDARHEQCMSKATSATDMAECYGAYTKAWDKILNANYKNCMSKADPEQQKQIRAAQRAWIDYRDKMSKALFEVIGGGGTFSQTRAQEFYSSETRRQALLLSE